MRRLGLLLLWAVLAAAGLAFIGLAVGPRVLPYETVTMLTGSMGATAPAGSVVVDVAEPVSRLRAGQVISFHPPLPGRPVVTHRVLSVRHTDGRVLIRTRGDANPTADPWVAQIDGSRVWRMRAVVPHLGTAIRLLRTPAARLALTWAVPAALLVWFLTGVWRSDRAEQSGGEPACSDDPSPAESQCSRCVPPLRRRLPARSRGRRRCPPRPRSYRRRRQPSRHRRL